MNLPKALPCLLLLLLFGGGIAQSVPPVASPPQSPATASKQNDVEAKPEITDAIAGGYTVVVRPVEVKDKPHHLYATLNAYKCETPSLDPSKPHKSSIGDEVIYTPGQSLSRVINLDERLNANDSVCVMEEIHYDCKRLLDDSQAAEKDKEICSSEEDDPLYSYIVSLPKVPEPRGNSPLLASMRSERTYARIATGVDVSAAASADPAANFMADFSFDVPFSNLDSSLYTRYSANGYLRLASIAQPGKINGIASPATYIKPLTDSTPNNLVQSWEGNLAFARRFGPDRNLGEQNAFWTTSGIVDGGFITPISANQTDTTPTVYVANKAIYDYYTKAPVASAAASKAITDACVLPASGAFPTCYVAHIPQDRTRFFRSYAVGVTFKRYRYQGTDNLDKPYKGEDKFDFPAWQRSRSGRTNTSPKDSYAGLFSMATCSGPSTTFLKATGPVRSTSSAKSTPI